MPAFFNCIQNRTHLLKEVCLARLHHWQISFKILPKDWRMQSLARDFCKTYQLYIRTPVHNQFPLIEPHGNKFLPHCKWQQSQQCHKGDWLNKEVCSKSICLRGLCALGTHACPLAKVSQDVSSLDKVYTAPSTQNIPHHTSIDTHTLKEKHFAYWHLA